MPKIHRVMSGPFPADEYEENHVMIWCLVEDDNGEIDNYELYLESPEEAYQIIKHFSESIQPLEMNFD